MKDSHVAATDTCALDGLLLVAADIKKSSDFAQINVIHHGVAFCIRTCSVRDAKEWLGKDAQRLVRWDPSFIEDDELSGIYRKPSFQTPAWVVHWEEIRHLDGVKDREKIAGILGIPLEDMDSGKEDGHAG